MKIGTTALKMFIELTDGYKNNFMNFIEGVKEKFKQFAPASWAVDNRTAIYIIAVLISVYGLMKFNNMPKEQFPDIVVPTISIVTVYAGNSPKDIENLVTRPIEKTIERHQWSQG